MSLNDDLKKVQAAQRDAQKDLASIINRIKNGETTGDCVRDFCLAVYGSENPAQRKYFRKLQDTLVVGEPVLVAYESVQLPTHGGCFERPWEIRETLSERLGVMNGVVQFDPKTSRLILPMESYSQFGYPLPKDSELFSTSPSRPGWRVVQGGIAVSAADLMMYCHSHLGETFGHTRMYLLSGDPLVQYALGERDDETHFSIRMKEYAQALEMLGKKAPKSWGPCMALP
ncbi:hypothetical protein HY642_07120 [Candidatus Woesearchaeota archaeon]|nr:hypothetical protein [Candidatus Woesearchaeota archaeon]